MSSSFLDQAEFADNPEPRCPVVLLLDTSGSMRGDPVQQLNLALVAFSQELKTDPLASLRVEVAVVTFGGKVRVLEVSGEEEDEIGKNAERAFVTVEGFHPPVLQAKGGTPMGEAVQTALALLHDRKEIYKANSMDYFRPWLFLLTDGHPTDEWRTSAEQVKLEENRKGVIFFGVGVEGADMSTLSQFSSQRPPLKLQGLAFSELFQWLSKSLSVVARSKLGEQVPLPPVGWAEVDTSA